MAVEFSGDFVVHTPREEAFSVLSDCARFSPLLPTYQGYEAHDDGSSNITVRVGVGKIRGTAVVTLDLIEQHPPESATWAGKGKIMGGAFTLAAGFDLDELGPSRTGIRWRGDLTIYGRLTSLAGGLLQPIARKQIEQLIHAIQQALGGESAETAARPQPGTART